jgi:hypothetical protein
MGFFNKIKKAIGDRLGNEAAKKIRGNQGTTNQGYNNYNPSVTPSEPQSDPEFEARKAAHEREMQEQAMQMEKQAMQMTTGILQAQKNLMDESARALKNHNDKTEE